MHLDSLPLDPPVSSPAREKETGSTVETVHPGGIERKAIGACK
jgi:hypothetical protein